MSALLYHDRWCVPPCLSPAHAYSLAERKIKDRGELVPSERHLPTGGASLLRHNSRRACGQRTQRGLVRAAASASRALPYAPTVPAARTCHSSAHGPTRRPVQAIKSNRPGHALRRAVPAAPADWPRTEQARPAAAATGEPTRNRRPLGGHTRPPYLPVMARRRPLCPAGPDDWTLARHCVLVSRANCWRKGNATGDGRAPGPGSRFYGGGMGARWNGTTFGTAWLHQLHSCDCVVEYQYHGSLVATLRRWVSPRRRERRGGVAVPAHDFHGGTTACFKFLGTFPPAGRTPLARADAAARSTPWKTEREDDGKPLRAQRPSVRSFLVVLSLAAGADAMRPARSPSSEPRDRKPHHRTYLGQRTRT